MRQTPISGKIPHLMYPNNIGDTIRFRILPPTEEAKGKFCPLSLQWHTFERAKKDGILYILQCPKRLVNSRWEGTCPACTAAATAYHSQSLSLKEAKGMMPWERHYFHIFDRADNFPKAFAASKPTYKHFVGHIIGDPTLGWEAMGDITDIYTGRDISIRVERMVQQFPQFDITYHQPGPLNESKEICEFFKEWPYDFDDLVSNDTDKIEYVLDRYYQKPKKRRLWRSIDEPWQP